MFVQHYNIHFKSLIIITTNNKFEINTFSSRLLKQYLFVLSI